MSREALRLEFMDAFSALIVQLQQEGIPGDRYADTIAQADIPDLLRHELGELRLLRNRCAHQGEPGNAALGLAELESGLRRLNLAQRQVTELKNKGHLGARRESIPTDQREAERQRFLQLKAQQEEDERLAQEREEAAFQARIREAAQAASSEPGAQRTPGQERKGLPDRRGHPRIILSACLLLMADVSLLGSTPLISALLAALAVIVWLI